MRNLFSGGLKDNCHLAFGFMTGILRVAKESIFSLFMITKSHSWEKVLHPTEKIYRILFMAFIAAFCHFGGNLLNAVAAPVVSVVIATEIGYSYGIWSYLLEMV